MATAGGSARTDRTWYTVLCTKDLVKKQKSWNDAFLVLDGKAAILLDSEGKQIGRELTKATSFPVGDERMVGSWLVDVESELPSGEGESGRIFLASGTTATAAAALPAAAAKFVRAPAPAAAPVRKAFIPLRPLTPAPSAASNSNDENTAPSVVFGSKGPSAAPAPAPAPAPSRPPAPLTALSASQHMPLVSGMSRSGPRPRNDPFRPGALILAPVPSAEEDSSSSSSSASGGAGSSLGGYTHAMYEGQQPTPPGTKLPVVVDSFLASVLQPHQRDGLRFLWNSITGDGPAAAAGGGPGGCILADDMGLGKTLQAIALIWTALKQSSAGSTSPVAHKALVVCPASLVGNWRSEFKRWLSDERCKPIAITQQGKDAETEVACFVAGSTTVHPVLIISYEMLRKHHGLLCGGGSGGRGGAASIGLLICDEAHRLKSAAGNQTIAALAALPTKRRVLLTGTPLQNELSELYALCDFCRPGCLGTLASFKRNFQAPIEASRDKHAPPAVVQLGNSRAAELAAHLSTFVLRRTSAVVESRLPPKTEHILLCRLSPLQVALYTATVTAYLQQSSCTGDAEVLCALNALRKICAHPQLLWSAGAPAAAAPLYSLAIGQSAAKRAKLMEAASAVPDDGGDAELSDSDEDESADAAAAAVAPSGAAVTAAASARKRLVVTDSDDEADTAAQGPVAATPVADGDEDEVLSLTDDEAEEDAAADAREQREAQRKVPSATLRGLLPGVRSGPAFSSESDIMTRLRPLFPADYPSEVLAGTGSSSSSSSSSSSAALDQAVAASGKLLVLDQLLAAIRAQAPGDRVVLVSSWARTLDILQCLCAARGYATVRLDGSTPAAARSEIVTRFNSPSSSTFIFLLSAAAGGVGLNLIGANRLILMDVNWNPAVDAQALARVWRMGQRKHVYIYRLVAAWTVEEKVLQRQLLKQQFSNVLGGAEGVDEEDGGGGHGEGHRQSTRLSREEVKELFHVDPSKDGSSLTAISGMRASSSSAAVAATAAPRRAYDCDTYRVLSASTSSSGDSGCVKASTGSVQQRASLRDPWPVYDGPAAVHSSDATLHAALVCLERATAAPSATASAAPPIVAFVRTLKYNQDLAGSATAAAAEV